MRVARWWRSRSFKGAVSGTYAMVLERSDTPEGLGSAAPEVFFE